LKSGKENNLKEWQKSDERAKSIEKAAANKGVNINTAVTEENIKQDAIYRGDGLWSWSSAISEIENNRPFFSMIPNHFRLCRGYISQNGYTYLRLNDPLPVGSTYGNPGLLERTYGSSESTRIYIR
jgi:hypothetical protein